MLQAVALGGAVWLGSAAVDVEIARTPDVERRRRVEALAALATSYVALSPVVRDRARAYEAAGLGAFDALHLACAAAGAADALLSTDDRFVRRAVRLAADVPVRVVNPVTWLTEALPR